MGKVQCVNSCRAVWGLGMASRIWAVSVLLWVSDFLKKNLAQVSKLTGMQKTWRPSVTLTGWFRGEGASRGFLS